MFNLLFYAGLVLTERVKQMLRDDFEIGDNFETIMLIDIFYLITVTLLSA